MKTSSLLATSLHGDKLSSQVQAKVLDDRNMLEKHSAAAKANHDFGAHIIINAGSESTLCPK
jgi:hypothetical protein